MQVATACEEHLYNFCFVVRVTKCQQGGYVLSL